MAGFVTFSSLGRHGRFANQIFQIAGTIGIARKNGLQPVFPTWRNLDHVEKFGSNEDINVFQHFVNPLPGFKVPFNDCQIVAVPWGYSDIRLAPGQNYDLTGHMQSLKFFDHCIDEVRHYMKMVGEGEVIHDVVAVHWRKGDYDDKYHPVQPMAYYVEAIQRFPRNSTFMLFSDDDSFYLKLSAALRENGLNAQMIQLKEDYLRSFAIMKKCRHFIIANSSYSAAAAILSESHDKIVVAPKRWFGPAYTGITGADIYCPGWQLI